MVEFKGKPIIDHIIDTFNLCGIDDIIVVSGYAGDVLESHLYGRGVRFIRNEQFDSTNMVYSLFCAENEFNDDLIISYSDIIFSPRVLHQLMGNPSPISVAIDLNWQQLWDIRMENVLSDAETLKISAEGHIDEIGLKPESIDEIEGQYIGLISMRSESLTDLISVYARIEGRQLNGRKRDNIFMTDLLQEFINSGMIISADRFNGGWLEIDSLEDLSSYDDRVTELPGWRWQHLLEPVSEIGLKAGDVIMQHFGTTEIEAIKGDASPLTKADLAAHTLIVEQLEALPDRYPIISEESVSEEDWQKRQAWDRYWMIDPLDGTKDFLQGSENFSVNIALMVEGSPVLGVVYAPVPGKLYCASDSWGSFMFDQSGTGKKILSVVEPGEQLHVLTSKNHLDERTKKHLENINIKQVTHMGSSLKLCHIAEGLADIYPRLGPLSEWDIAAASIILTEAGGHVINSHGDKLIFANPDGRIASFEAVSSLKFKTFLEQMGSEG